jgi:putative intracellular protease/amidase/YHS domain-containing protein
MFRLVEANGLPSSIAQISLTKEGKYSMNRRKFLRQSAGFGLAARLSSVCACNNNPEQVSAAASSTDGISPLPVPASGMLPAAFVLGKTAEVLDFCGPLEVFAGATTKDGNQLFSPYMVAGTKDPVTVGGGMQVVPDHDFKTAPQPKIIVIPAMDMTDAPQEMYDWIRNASKTTDVTMSVCNGAFVLAKTGLLNGKSATAHHGGYFRFAASYPEVQLKRGARFVEEGNLASSGGISSGIDLALRVVERYVGRELTEQLIDAMEYQGKGWLNADSNEAFARMPELLGARPRCPVCFSDADCAITSSHNGKTYYFCSQRCKELFEKHTEVFDRFLSEDLAAKPKSNI